VTGDDSAEALRQLTACRCEPAWTERRLHAPTCLEEYRDDVDEALAAAEARGYQRAIDALRDEHAATKGASLLHDVCTDVEAVGPVFAPDPVDPASMAGWRCGRCGSSRWVGWRAGPEHEGWPLQAQCVPCGRVQAMTERGRWWRHG
jgi:hypothetical protein